MRACETLRRHRNPGGWFLLGVKWLPNTGKTPKGTGTAREEAANGLPKAAATEHETLWRSERPREDTFKREFEGSSTAQNLKS